MENRETMNIGKFSLSQRKAEDMIIKKKELKSDGLIDTSCLGIGEYDCYKIVGLSNNRVEMVFIHSRDLEYGTTVRIRAISVNQKDYLTKTVTGSKKRKDGLWDIFVIVRNMKIVTHKKGVMR